ncbi:MAG: penicillin-binding transpeptidase domain-containing protein, partial [Patescibacteria group bacterium]
ISSSIEVVSPQTTIKAPHFVFYVKNQLIDEFGIRKVEEGGLNLKTSLDLEIQESVETILEEEIDKIRNLNVTNGAVLVTKPSTGEILAMVGSVDYFSEPYGAFNVTTALRQPGSSIKPLMYSLALQDRFTAATVLDDTPVVFNIPGSRPYRPVNYDNRFHGRVALRYALASSYNIPAVKVLNTIGVDNFIQHARNMGITSWEDSSRFGLSLTLGGGEVKMTDMAKAFGVFANQGIRQDLSPILEVRNSSGDIVYEGSNESKRVLDPGVSFIISDILSDNIARAPAFGRASTLEIPGYKVAVKTGTTNDKKDNWTVGYTPEYLVVVWVGNNNNAPMHQTLTSGITGASPIWNRVMSMLLTEYSTRNTWFEKPVSITEKICYGGRVEYFINGTDRGINCARQPIQSISPTPTPEPQQ